jgi:hypothetical protein
MEPIDESVQRAAEKGNDLVPYFRGHAIFSPADLADDVDQLVTSLRQTHQDFVYLRQSDEVGSGRVHDWNEIWERVSTQIPDLRKKPQTRFRELLGDRARGS